MRWHSTIEANQCPHRAGEKSESMPPKHNVEFVNVPKLPFIGSMIPMHSGMAAVDLTKSYDTWYENHKKFGHFYSAGLPAVGKGIFLEGA